MKNRKMEKKPSWWLSPRKYFLHGILFSLLILVLVIVWVFISAILILTGYFIGLIIALILLFLGIGSLNSFLTRLVWSIPIKSGWISLLIHGFVLSIALIIVHIPVMIISYNAPGLATAIALVIVETFIDGLIAKKVAVYWKEKHEEPKIEAPQML